MRLTHKYKIYAKMSFLHRYPKRILKFKRPKWEFIQILIRKKLPKYYYTKRGRRKKRKQKQKLISFVADNTKLLVKLSFMAEMRKAYKQRLLHKRSLIVWHNNDKRFLKKFAPRKSNKLINDSLQEYFNKFYNLNHFLFALRFTASVFEANKLLQNRKILLNGNIVKQTTALKKFDLITYTDLNLNFKILRNKYTPYDRSYTFIEVDYYSQASILLKDRKGLNNLDMSFSLLRYLNLLEL